MSYNVTTSRISFIHGHSAVCRHSDRNLWHGNDCFRNLIALSALAEAIRFFRCCGWLGISFAMFYSSELMNTEAGTDLLQEKLLAELRGCHAPVLSSLMMRGSSSVDMGRLCKSSFAKKQVPCSCGGTSRFVHTAGPKHEGRGGSSSKQLQASGQSLHWGIDSRFGRSKRFHAGPSCEGHLRFNALSDASGHVEMPPILSPVSKFCLA